MRSIDLGGPQSTGALHLLAREITFIELMTSDRTLKASREGSK